MSRITIPKSFCKFRYFLQFYCNARALNLKKENIHNNLRCYRQIKCKVNDKSKIIENKEENYANKTAKTCEHEDNNIIEIIIIISFTLVICVAINQNKAIYRRIL